MIREQLTRSCIFILSGYNLDGMLHDYTLTHSVWMLHWHICTSGIMSAFPMIYGYFLKHLKAALDSGNAPTQIQAIPNHLWLIILMFSKCSNGLYQYR